MKARQGTLGTKSAREGGTPGCDRGRRLVVEDRVGEIVARSTTGGDQRNARAVGTPENNLQVADPGVGDIQRHLEIFHNANRPCHGQRVRQAGPRRVRNRQVERSRAERQHLPRVIEAPVVVLIEVHHPGGDCRVVGLGGGIAVPVFKDSTGDRDLPPLADEVDSDGRLIGIVAVEAESRLPGAGPCRGEGDHERGGLPHRQFAAAESRRQHEITAPRQVHSRQAERTGPLVANAEGLRAGLADPQRTEVVQTAAAQSRASLEQAQFGDTHPRNGTPGVQATRGILAVGSRDRVVGDGRGTDQVGRVPQQSLDVAGGQREPQVGGPGEQQPSRPRGQGRGRRGPAKLVGVVEPPRTGPGVRPVVAVGSHPVGRHHVGGSAIGAAIAGSDKAEACPEVAVGRTGVEVGCRPDGDHPRCGGGESGRELHAAGEVVATGNKRGGPQSSPGARASPGERRGDRAADRATPPAVVHDVHVGPLAEPVPRPSCGVVDRRGDVRVGGRRPRRSEDPDWQDAGLLRDPGHPNPVVPTSRRDSRDTGRMGIVRGIGPGIVVPRRAVGGEVPAVGVVDVPIGIIVQSITGDLARVDEQVRCQVGVGQFHPVVHDGDHDAVGAGGQIPGSLGIHVGIDRASGDPIVFEVPLQVVERVVRDREFAKVAIAVRLGPGQSGVCGEPFGQLQGLGPRPRREGRHEMIGRSIERPVAGEAGVVPEERRRRLPGLEGQDDFIGRHHPVGRASGLEHFARPANLREAVDDLLESEGRIEGPTTDGEPGGGERSHRTRGEWCGKAACGESKDRGAVAQLPFEFEPRERTRGSDQVENATGTDRD